MTKLFGVLLAAALTGCDSPAPGNTSVAPSDRSAVAAVEASPPAPVPTLASSPTVTFKPIAIDTFAAVYRVGATRSEIERQVRPKCAGKQWCKVIGWTDGSVAASAMPMTDREADAQKFVYTLNRSSGMDEFAWL